MVDEDGVLFKVFDSGASCGKFLGIGRTSVYSKIKSNKPVVMGNNKYYLRNVK